MTEPRSGCWDSLGLTLHYVEWGAADAPLVIVHHGWLDQARAWDPVASRLAARYRVVVLDARGHGESEWIGSGGSYYFPDYLLDLHHLLEALGTTTTPVSLVGHSMGGSVVGYFAGAFPSRIKTLTLVEGLGPPAEGPDVAAARLEGFVTTTSAGFRDRASDVMASVEHAAARLRRSDALLAPDLALQLAEHATRPVRGGVTWKFDPLHKARSGAPFVVENAMALWRAITAPVLSVDGEKTAFRWPDLPARRAAIPGLRHVVVPGAGHNVHLHAPEALADLILAHLDAHAAP